MKMRIISMLAILAVFGLAIAAYAYTQNETIAAGTDKACCSKGGESCPMKAKGHDDKGEHVGMSCDKMKSGSDHATAEGHECCGCCGDSCPMEKKEGAMAATSASATDVTNGCCDNCECCKGKDQSKSEV